ncbi:MAG: hypothetical protein ACK4VI_06245 [Alphaproteobacteria bacterium]
MSILQGFANAMLWPLSTWSRCQRDSEDIERLRLRVPAQKIIREDQLHGAFIDRTEGDYFGQYFAKHHQRAIAAMRVCQAHEYYSGANIPMEELKKRDVKAFDDLGFFPQIEQTAAAKESAAYKNVGLTGVYETVHGVEPQRLVFRYARLGDWLSVWEGFDPVINMHAASKMAIFQGKASEVMALWERIANLPDHADLFRYDFAFRTPSNWLDRHNPDKIPEQDMEAIGCYLR